MTEDGMEEKINGRIIKGTGGLYTVLLTDGENAGDRIFCRARGALRHRSVVPLAGDNVLLGTETGADGALTYVIDGIGERKNSLIRPPLANLDFLFVTLAAASPSPLLLTVDKLISICVYNKIEPVIVITKSELDGQYAEELAHIYTLAGFDTFVTSSVSGQGTEELGRFANALPAGSISAFAGASGVGKSTLMNRLFPALSLSTSEISRKTERGRHTTRQTELFGITAGNDPVFVADTPGFTMLDFGQFDFFGLDDLPHTMRDFSPYIGKCRYRKCTHTKEEGCAVLEAVRNGEIAPSRHESYLMMYDVLKAKKKW